MDKELEHKKQFAIELLYAPNDPFACAKKVFPDNPGKVLSIFSLWQTDKDVLEFKEAYVKEHGDSIGLATKEDLARSVFEMAEDKKIDSETRLKYYRLYGDIRGYIEKPGINIDQSVTNVANKVMIVKDQGTDDEWEHKLITQQEELMSGNSKST